MKILLLSHAANRSGAPAVLLELARFLRGNSSHDVQWATLRGGELEREFDAQWPRFAGEKLLRRRANLAAIGRRLGDFSAPKMGTARALARRGASFEARFGGDLARKLAGFDVVYANCAISGEAFLQLRQWPRNTRLVAHVHEMNWALSQAGDGWKWLRERADFFVAASHAVARELEENQGIAREKIGVVHEFLDFSRLETDQNAAKSALRRDLGVPESAFLVGGCGAAEWRKGLDWWAQVAASCGAQRTGQRRAGEVHFVWLGARDNAFLRGVKFDVARWNIENRVHFLEPRADTRDFFAGLDAFALSSREDPFPLVAIQAAAQGVPVACFAQAGGAAELVGENAGAVVPYGDVSAMARALESWRFDATFAAQIGQNAAQKARKMCDVSVGAPKILEFLEKRF